MALVASSPLSQSGNPTIGLEAALAGFKHALTAQQQQTFLTYTANALQQRPDISTVMQFVAELDALNHRRTMNSVATRLTTFLDATQQFISVVDTFVSSNPAIAALVWGGMKTAILAASNIFHYFDKVTLMIMDIGRTYPAYGELALLYHDSVPLQYAVCDYYAVLVRFATKIVEVSQRSQLAHLMTSLVNPFESDFKPLQDQIADATKLVRLRVSIAAGQLAKRESETNESQWKLFRHFQSDFKATQEKWKLAKNRREAVQLRILLLEQLSTIDHLKPWKQAQKRRLPNTAEWFRQEPAFQDWRSAKSTSILWCPGRMGIGKTVVVSNVVAMLFNTLESDHVISHHFCRTEYTASTSALNILGTIARQLLRQTIEELDVDDLQKLHEACQTMDADDIIDLLLSRSRADRKHFIVIDGLDVCPRDEIIILSKGLDRLYHQQEREFYILLSGRPDLEHALFNAVKPSYRMQITPDTTRADVNRYIDAALDHCLEQNWIQLSDPKMILRIANLLHEKYADLFLFVHLFIEELCSLNCEQDIWEILKNPPKQIDDLLGRKLFRVQANDHSVAAMKILRYCGVTKRPLTVNEISELISISILQPSLDRAKIPWNMDQIITACQGLAHVDEEDNTVTYFHQSVKQHFFSAVRESPAKFEYDETDLCLGQLCLTYLNFDNITRQITKVHASYNAAITPLEIGICAVESSSGLGNKFARKLLRSRTKFQHLSSREIVNGLENSLGIVSFLETETEQERQFHLLGYVQQYWIDHTKRLDPVEHPDSWRWFCALVESHNEHVTKPWVSEPSGQRSPVDDNGHETGLQAPKLDPSRQATNRYSLSLEWALKGGHAALLSILVRKHNGELLDATMRQILVFTIDGGHQQLAEALVHYRCLDTELLILAVYQAAQRGSDIMLRLLACDSMKSNQLAPSVRTEALSFAAENGHLQAVERLLALGVDIDAGNGTHGRLNRTALHRAAEEGHVEVVERLLAAGAGVDVAVSDGHFAGATALLLAAERGHVRVVERLLAAGAGVDATVSRGNFAGATALLFAAECDHVEVVERLLAAGANVDATLCHGRFTDVTALLLAAKDGHVEVVERLLAANTDVNTSGEYHHGHRQTALMLAAEKGHVAVVERLLAANADVNSGFNDRTQLSFAAEAHVAMVEHLLTANLDIDAAGSNVYRQRTALMLAAESGHVMVVEQLLAANADVNCILENRSALSFAAEAGHVAVVERLLKANADVDGGPCSRLQYRTPLILAAQDGHIAVVERLLAANADVDAVSSCVDGRTALCYAARNGHAEIVKRLRNAGAKGKKKWS